MTALKTFTFADGRSLEIHHDCSGNDPRKWDNLGTMACFHKSYDLGDEKDGINGHGIDQSEYGGWEEMDKWIRRENPDCVILPLYLFDHSGLTMSTTSDLFRVCDGARWDWGQVGFIFVSRERINKEFGGRTNEQIEQYLRGEVWAYDQYLTGDIYGFILRDKPCETCDGPGKQLDSCWGFFGSDPTQNGMSDNLDDAQREELKVLIG